MMTINISLPKSMYQDAKVAVKAKRYASISELIRSALRRILYSQNITENGFTEEFEDQVLQSAAEPQDKDIVLKTDKDITDYFLHLKIPKPKKR